MLGREMSESSNDKSTERRRKGPLGDEGEETRQQEEPKNEDETQQVPTQQSDESEHRTRRADRRKDEKGDKATHVMRAPGAASGGYFEAMEEREERLRDIYGGADWLASFLGFVFALVAGAVLALIPAMVLIPLGFTMDFSGDLGAAAITGLVITVVVLFLMYFFGGYVAGRLARFNGGLNGIMLLAWTVIVAILLLLAGGIFSGFLPSGFVEGIQSAIQDALIPTFNDLVSQGVVGIVILVVAVLAIVLGAFFGGRAGGRYHRDIDYTL